MLYYVRYEEQANIDYIFLLSLYGIAKRSKTERLLNTIEYTSIQQLKELFAAHDNYNISTAKITKHLKNDSYSNYFDYDRQKKTITLHNNFRKHQDKKYKFITITENERIFLINSNSNFLCKYFFYIKYYCGKSKNKSTDFTAKQFLSATGYSCNSGNLLTQICNCNALLLDKGFISIQKYRDVKGNERNIYTTSG